MAKSLEEWQRNVVDPVKDKPLRWLSERHFFRDPLRPVFSDTNFFFSPADGIIVYQKTLQPDECLVDIKGKPYSLKEAMRDDSYAHESIVIGIFMTFYDVHINRIPFPGTLSYKELDPIESYNHPMLALENALVHESRIDLNAAGFLHNNQRMLNRVFSSELGQSYYILQIADYDVDSITPFRLQQNFPFMQNQRFSQIRFGSQVDLILPLSGKFDFTLTQETGVHVEAGVDPLIRITEKQPAPPRAGSNGARP